MQLAQGTVLFQPLFVFNISALVYSQKCENSTNSLWWVTAGNFLTQQLNAAGKHAPATLYQYLRYQTGW